jgi:cell division protein FtsW
MAILAEEFGFAGVVVVLFLMLMIVLKALKMGNMALQKERPFDAYLAYAIGIWFSIQTAINVGASVGVLPTKGLTFPLLSYGGSSLIIMSIAVALLIRIDFELRVDGVQAMNRNGNSPKKPPKSGKRQVTNIMDDVIDVAVEGVKQRRKTKKSEAEI